MRHLELKYLWVQDAVEEGSVEVKRINGESNIAYHLTKPKNWTEMKDKYMMLEATLYGYRDRTRSVEPPSAST